MAATRALGARIRRSGLLGARGGAGGGFGVKAEGTGGAADYYCAPDGNYGLSKLFGEGIASQNADIDQDAMRAFKKVLEENGYGKAICVLPHDASQHDAVTATRFEDHIAAAGFDVQTVGNQGKGAGLKTHDCWTAALCMECHTALDQGKDMSKEEDRKSVV